MNPPVGDFFWLSHHAANGHDRCWKLGGLWVCARCLGLYPVLALAVALQFYFHAPLGHRLDLPVALGLLLPALGDWAWAHFQPHAFSNLWRTATGMLLGGALARSLYIHFQRPWPEVLLLQGAVVTAVALPVILITYGRSSPG